MASLFDDQNRQGSGSVLKSVSGQARRRKASPAGRPTPGKPTQCCIYAGTRTRTHTLRSQLITRASTRQPGLAVSRPGKDLISKVGGVDSKDGDLGFYYLFYKF